MKWWKPLLIFLLCATPSWAGFWSDFPGVGPGTVLNDVIIDNSTINSSTLNQPIINDPTFNGTSTYNPGTVINYDPSTIINGPDGSVWYYNGIDNLKNLTIAVGGSITLPPGSTLNLPDGSVWNSTGLSNLNLQAGGVITVGGLPAGGACPANQFYIALSSSLVPTCAPITNIPGPVTINNPTFTGIVTGPDGGVWSNAGIGLPSTSRVQAGSINITGNVLLFNNVAVGGTCPDGQYVYSISPTLVPVCSTPAGGGGGGSIPTPVSVANGGLGQGNAPSIGQILVANGPTQYVAVTMSGDATINTAGVVTVNSVNGQTGPFQPLTSTSTTAPTNPINGQFWFDPTSLQTYVWYTDPTSSQWVAVVNLTGATLTNPILNNATFTGTVTFPNGSIADSALAGSYSGTGACATGLFVTGLNRNAPPTCNPAGVIVSATPPATPVDSQLWFNSQDLQTYLRYNDGSSTQWVPVVNLSGATLNNPTITNPTFLGTLQFPDGSYYDVQGHEVMKALGIGEVARIDGTNGTSGNSITVKDSGWGAQGTLPNTDPDAWWDNNGINRLRDIEFEWPTIPVPDVPNGYDLSADGGELALDSDTLNNATGQPRSDLALYNQSNYLGGGAEGLTSGYQQFFQSEGLEFVNSIGIHTTTWQSSGMNCQMDNYLQGNCAIVATASTENNNLDYQEIIQNTGTGNAAAASYQLWNGAPHTGGMYLTGTGWTPTATYNKDQLVIDTTAANGVAINPPLIFHNVASSSLFWGTLAQPSATLSSLTATDNLQIAAGAHAVAGPSWISDATTAQALTLNTNGYNFNVATGQTVGATTTWTGIASINQNGFVIDTGAIYDYNTNIAAYPTLQVENQTVTIANGASATLPACAGLVVLNDRYANGSVCMFLVGHGTVNIVNQIGSWCVANTSTPAAGQLSLAYDGTTYRIYNNFGNQTVLGIFNVCSRMYPD